MGIKPYGELRPQGTYFYRGTEGWTDRRIDEWKDARAERQKLSSSAFFFEKAGDNEGAKVVIRIFPIAFL